MRRLVSLVNWHLTLRVVHSVHADVSVASHYTTDENSRDMGDKSLTLTFRSRQASQLGSFRRCRYARRGFDELDEIDGVTDRFELPKGGNAGIREGA